MTEMTDPAGSPAVYPTAVAPGPSPSTPSTIFKGPNGLRAGWRLLIFLVLFLAMAAGLGFVLHHIPALQEWQKAQPKEMTPGVMLLGEGVAALSLFLAALFMTLIERRSFADYYLPPREAFGKRFWQGVPYGFAMVSLLMAVIAALHGFSIEGVALDGGAIVKYGLLYAVAFFLVAFFEEFSFRGYMQSTLGSGIGFWPAAIILSILFGAIHLGNQGEAWFGALMAGSFGILAAFALSRTGNIWFPLGIHASWDWGETYFYSVPDSGAMAQGHLLNSTFHGPTWLTGGTVGPEGSVFALVVLIVGGIGIHFLFPTKRVTS